LDYTHIIFHLLPTSQVNIRDRYYIQYYRSKVCIPHFISFIRRSWQWCTFQ